MQNHRRAVITLAIGNLILLLGFNLWRSVFNNFAVEDLGLGADSIGMVQAIREIPGLMGFVVGFLVLFLSEMRIGGLSLVLMGIGIVLTALVNDLGGLIVATLIMSIGFHFFVSSKDSAALILLKREEAPRILGHFASLGALATLIGTLIVFATLESWGYRNTFIVTGVFVTIFGLILLPFTRQPVRVKPEQRRPPIRRAYGVFYALQLLMGSRRHIFSTFAIFLLVERYNVTAQLITLLILANSVIGLYSGQAIGKIIARFGEKLVMRFNFIFVSIIFINYAILPNMTGLHENTFRVGGLSVGDWVLFPGFDATPALLILLVLFITDQVLSGFTIALVSYFQKIAIRPDDITPNMSLGQTINHIAGVGIPLLGGIVWDALGAQYTFMAGVVIVLIALGVTSFMRDDLQSLEITVPASD
jgi:predicted MFS family arabinose efflux permease